MYFARNPPKRCTVSATHFWYAEMTSRRSSGSVRAASAVEPTRSENITVICRRSAVPWGLCSTAAERAAAVVTGTSSPRAASMIRRCPSRTPMSLRFWSVRWGSAAMLIPFSAKHSAYCPRPSLSSQSATCCIAAAPLIIGLHPPASASLSDKSATQ
jgi:hypothetical protein